MTIPDKEIKKANRLIEEKSPYLLQHACNPVDWYPWGEEAFNKAKAEDKPIFLSIGYSTCHWCHVMERESFEDPEVAAVLNKDFISIKVDREERPDIDSVYMSVCQALTGSGGWPLTIIMTPEKEPFFAATYIPKHNLGRMAGMLDLLPHIARLWKNERETVINSARSITETLSRHLEGENKGQEVGEQLFHRAFRDFTRFFDASYGGFGEAPKFPTPHNLLFLMRYYKMTGKKDALHMVEKTLQSMYQGGIYDHIGFGFSRYSTDRRWMIPHFEKMLYDNALMTIAFLEAFQITGNPFYSRVAREILDYVAREMTSKDGAFFSAQDADSEGEEGKFYSWTPEEVIAVLGDTAGKQFCEQYDIHDKGNFEGKSIPNLIKTGISEEKRQELEASRQKLFNYREKRVPPFKDDKILTGWNGMMIAALAKAYRVLGEEQYLVAAEKAAWFVLQRLRRSDGRLLARFRDGEAQYPAYAADYAFLVWGLIELYESSFNMDYLRRALELNQDMLNVFWDQEHGGLFIYGDDSERLLLRPKESYDGAVPSENSVAALNFVRLARLTGNTDLEGRAFEQLKFFGGRISQIPTAHSFFLMAAMYALKGQELVIVGEKDEANTKQMLALVQRAFLPHTAIAFKEAGNGQAAQDLIPYWAGMKMVDNKTTAYICRNYSCLEPVTHADNLMEALYN